MKRKRIISILSIVLVLFAFAGCDEILEAFYPEFAEGESGAYGISLYVQIVVPEADISPDQQPTIVAKAVKAFAFDKTAVETAITVPNWEIDEFGNNIYYGYVDLYFEEEGDYEVMVWGEVDGNQILDFDEPQRLATWWRDDPDHPDGGFEDTVFSLWEDFETFIYSEVIIDYFGTGPVLNLNYFVRGPFIVNVNNLGPKTFEVETQDPNQKFDELKWELLDLLYTPVKNGSLYPSQDTTYLTFDIDFTSIPLGKYWLKTRVNYPNADPVPKFSYVRVINEAGSGTPYTASLQISNAYDWPLFLADNKEYRVIARVNDPYGGYSESIHYVEPVAGLFVLDVTGLSYNPTGYMDADPIDNLEIIIDFGEDGETPGDAILIAPLGLDSSDGGVALLDYLAEDFFIK
jgi:hypothetical protein